MKNLKLVIEKAQAQDQKAFNELFNSYWNYLYNFQLKKTGADDADHRSGLWGVQRRGASCCKVALD